jgi:hypothetical protein
MLEASPMTIQFSTCAHGRKDIDLILGKEGRHLRSMGRDGCVINMAPNDCRKCPR